MNIEQIRNLAIGTKVLYNDRDRRRWVEATYNGFGEKDGELVVDVVIGEDECRWGYADQIKAR